ncbi:pilus assembly protein TadG-related protein [Flavimaricola marinus]|uniref:pilus assembly protein TadG-related protein n=1 Tax=Flavimaricola marinus TaxID=1819565 RepID=UPI0014554648|nr:pilus assembly protein TadG-related protein [Flavimaricola marinus]
MAKFLADEDGAVAVIVALLLTVLLGFVALGVDVASLYRERAQLQSVSDLAAMSAIADTDNAETRVSDVIAMNSRTSASVLDLTTGRFLRNPELPPGQRFTPLPDGSPGINAVTVALADVAPIHFATIFSGQTSVELDRRAMATRTGAASFALDSHILRLDGDRLNEGLSELLRASVSLSAGDIQVLAEASLNLGELLDALGNEIGFDARNPAEILNATMDAAALIRAMQAILPADVASRLAGISALSGGVSMSVASLVGGIDADLGLTADDFVAGIEVAALDVIRAIILTSPNQESVSLDVGVSIAGVSNVDATVISGEPPATSGWIALGEEGVQLHRAAARIQVETELSPALLGNLGVGVSVAELRLPLYVELAGSTATLERINCRLTEPTSIAARFLTAHTPLHPANGTAVAALYLGNIEMPASPTNAINPSHLEFADILRLDVVIDLPLLPDIVLADVTVQARSMARVGRSKVETIQFTQAQITAGDTTAGFGSGDLLTTGIASLLSPETTEFRIKPEQGDLLSGVGGPVIETVLELLPARLLAALAAPLDNAIDATLEAAGLHVGEGDLTLTGHHCEPIRLVQ